MKPETSAGKDAGGQLVVLLHGLTRTSRSMEPLARKLRRAGYHVRNVSYDSRETRVEPLAETVVGKVLADCRAEGATRIHFVTHSLGGILVRLYLERHSVPELGRVVMLGPPNAGSEVVDKIGNWTLYGWVNGPAGRELGTDAESVPSRLGPVNFPLGIIAGNRSINWINSLLMIPGPDDGKVSVKRTRVAGMTDHLVLPVTHPMIMRNREVHRQVLAFLVNGRFEKKGGGNDETRMTNDER